MSSDDEEMQQILRELATPRVGSCMKWTPWRPPAMRRSCKRGIPGWPRSNGSRSSRVAGKPSNRCRM
jgi:hypothetical protein